MPGRVYIQFIGTATGDTQPSVLLFTDTRRYVFNAGEGMQRFCMEHKVRIAQLSEIFLSHIGSTATGGLPGLLLTLYETGKRQLHIHGPPNLAKFMHSLRFFVWRPKYEITLSEYQPGVDAQPPAFQDDQLMVTPLVLLDAEAETAPSALPPVASYVVRLRDVPGKFDVVKAKALGVPAGPMFSKLTRGESVTTPEGRVVQPSDCIGPPKPGPIFAFVVCPDPRYLPSLVRSPVWASLVHSDAPAVVAHVAPMTVLEHPQYRAWVAGLGPHTTHYVANDDVCAWRLAFVSQAASIAQRHLIDPGVFVLPHGCEMPARPPPDWGHVPAHPFEMLLSHVLLPHASAGPDRSAVPPPVPAAELMRGAMERPGIATLLAEYRGVADGAHAPPVPLVRGRSRLVFLGTGSAIPSKLRNVSGIYLQVPRGGLLLDCGEGSLGQLARALGPEVDAAVRGLLCVWVSHMHADHHLGLLAVLARRRQLQCPPLLVIGPADMQRWLEEYSAFEPLQFEFIDAVQLCAAQAGWTPAPATPGVTAASAAAAAARLTALQTAAELRELVAVPVVHCPDAYGLVVTHADGWKLVYSGDTRPCDALVAAGRGATVAIHEATFDNDKGQHAVEKNHSTVNEAIDVCLRMNAYRVLLTHFSQRYPKLPVLTGASAERVVVAFDLMCIDMADLPHLPAALPVLVQVCADDEDNDDDGTSVASADAAPTTAAEAAAAAAAAAGGGSGAEAGAGRRRKRKDIQVDDPPPTRMEM